MNNASVRHRKNQEAKIIAVRQWEANKKDQENHEVNKQKLRKNRNINIIQYEGPETDRLENNDRINKS